MAPTENKGTTDNMAGSAAAVLTMSALLVDEKSPYHVTEQLYCHVY